ncbi:hypothetical protein [Anaerobacillus sp. MEB173]|uniref:hypothetical protein n=1 Tax=Anaerobacillus sp. MEB173 TaxID=3383345 RepID=UPI003F8E4CE6
MGIVFLLTGFLLFYVYLTVFIVQTFRKRENSKYVKYLYISLGISFMGLVTHIG